MLLHRGLSLRLIRVRHGLRRLMRTIRSTLIGGRRSSMRSSYAAIRTGLRRWTRRGKVCCARRTDGMRLRLRIVRLRLLLRVRM